MAINLLPQDLKPKGYAVKLAINLKKVALVALLVFLVGALTVFAIFIFYNRQVSQSLVLQENLRNEIVALQETEQKMILLTDRIEKYSTIENSKSENSGVTVLEHVSEFISEGVSFKRVILADGSTKIAVYSDSLESLSGFILRLATSERFKSIYLTSLTFKPNEGYSAEFGFVP